MYTHTELERALGLSRRQVRERVEALAAVDGLLVGQVEALKAHIRTLEKQVEYLQGRLAEVLPLALPRPRSWWAVWRR